MLTPREYQSEAVQSVFDYFRCNHEFDLHPLVVIPTGGGKSLCMAMLIEQLLCKKPNFRIMLVTHSKQLIKQNFEEFEKNSDYKYSYITGIFSAGLKQKDYDQQILFAGVQSIYDKMWKVGKFDLIIVDEAHMIPKDSGKMYKTFFENVFTQNPDCKVVGFTATPYRLESGLLIDPPDNLFSHICYTADIKRLIREGFLCKPVSRVGKNNTAVDLSGVKIQGGDYVVSELLSIMSETELIKRTVQEIKRLTVDRKKILLFACSIQHAEDVTAELNIQGIKSAVVHSQSEEGDENIEAFKRDEIKCLVNVNMLTTGFNEKRIDCIIMLRPTKSPGLYYQMIGRGFRIHPDKTDFLVLDFAGNIAEHGAIDEIKVISKVNGAKGEIEKAPVKTCPGCEIEIHAAYRICPECGYEFEVADAKHTTTASNLNILSELPPLPEWCEVDEVTFSKHQKNSNKPATLRADYKIGSIKIASEWLCFNHEGFPKKKATQWFYNRLPEEIKQKVTIQDCHGLDVDGALQVLNDNYENILVPQKIMVDYSGKFPTILNYKF